MGSFRWALAVLLVTGCTKEAADRTDPSSGATAGETKADPPPGLAPDPAPDPSGSAPITGCDPKRYENPVDTSSRAAAKAIQIERPIAVPVRGCEHTDWFAVPIARSGQLSVRVERRMQCKRGRISLRRDGRLIAERALLDDGDEAARMSGTQTGSATWHLSLEAEEAGECDLFITFDESPPEIVSVSPKKISLGKTLTISGRGFGADPKAVEIVIGDAYAEVKSVRDTRIVTKVPFGARHGEVQLRVEEQATNVVRAHLARRHDAILVPLHRKDADTDEPVRDGMLVQLDTTGAEAVINGLVGRWSGQKIGWQPLTNTWAVRFPNLPAGTSVGSIEEALEADKRLREVDRFPDDLPLARWVIAGRAAITSSQGETLFTLHDDASWPAVALVDAKGHLTGVVHRAADAAQRLLLLDDQRRVRVMLGRTTSTRGARSGWTQFVGEATVFDDGGNPRVSQDLHGLALLTADGGEVTSVPLSSDGGRTVTVIDPGGRPILAVDGAYAGAASLLSPARAPVASATRDHLASAIVLHVPGAKKPVIFGDDGVEDPDGAWLGVLANHPGEERMLATGAHLRFRDRAGKLREIPAITFAPAIPKIAASDRLVGSASTGAKTGTLDLRRRR